MISPPVTVWPAKTFTPSRLELESRPLRLEPRPFLCAIFGGLLLLRARRAAADRDARDLQASQLLAVARGALVAALGLELEHAQLLAALVAEDRGLDLDAAEVAALEQRVVVAAVEQRLEVDGAALVAGQALDEQGHPLLDAVLLPAGADDGIGGFGHGLGLLAGFGLGTRTAPSAPAASAPRLGF